MNTKKEIVKFLEELAIGVQDKRDDLEAKIKNLKASQEHAECIKYSCTLLQIFNNSFEHVEGQLYEINYILAEITRDKRKKL